jgi:hypothetical protein
MDVPEQVETRAVRLEMTTDRFRASLFPAGDDVASHRTDGSRDMGTQNVDLADAFQKRGHLLVGDLASCP